MVAYNFQKQFVEPIRSREKTHTIRKNSKRRHAVEGDAIQLYTGMRTKSCQKIIEPDPVCVGSLPVWFDIGKHGFRSIRVGGSVRIDDLNEFAISDGFANL
jgi:hypothetical protein